MNVHKNANLTPAGRAQMVERLEAGSSRPTIPGGKLFSLHPFRVTVFHTLGAILSSTFRTRRSGVSGRSS